MSDIISSILSFFGLQVITTYSISVMILGVFVVISQILKHWYFSKGNLWYSYHINIITYICYIFLETIVALHDHAQRSLLIMNIVSIWALIMSIKGIIRIKKESKNDNT